MTFPSSRRSRRRAALALLVGVLAMGSGCWRATVVNRGVREGEPHETTGRIFIYGLVSTDSAHVKTGQICPNGVARVQSEHTFVDSLLGLVTLGIYTPVTIRYTCIE